MCVYEESLFLINGYNPRIGDFTNKIYRINLESEDQIWENIYIEESNQPAGNSGYFCDKDKLYLFGGVHSGGVTNHLLNISLSSSKKNVVELSKKMITPIARYGHGMVAYDDKLYIFGGIDKEGNYLLSMETYNIKIEKWQSFAINSSHSPAPRVDFAYTRTGEILVIFGGESDAGLLADMHYFNLRTLVWKAIEPKSNMNPNPRSGSCMAAAGDIIFIFGGVNKDGYSNELWIFDSGTSKYEMVNPNGVLPIRTQYGHCKAFLESGNVIFETYLGETIGKKPINAIYQYNYSFNTWTEIKENSFETTIRSQASALHFGSQLLVAGGSFRAYQVSNQISIYDITTNEYTLSAELPFHLYNAASVYYKNKLYIHGGGANFNDLPLTDIPINHLVVVDLDDECTQNQEFCISKCSPGTYFTNGECKACSEGTFKESIGAEECTKCRVNFYSDTEGADFIRFCKPCPVNTFNVNEGESRCYDCPSGTDCSLDAKKYNHIKTTESYQPDLYKSGEDIVEEYSMIFNIVLSLISLLVIISFLSFIKTRSLLTELDMYTLEHNYHLDGPMVARKTIIGGAATIVFLVFAVSIVFNMGLTYGVDNIAETKALVPLVALEQDHGSVISI
jgi:N-acetylneuraminic acid mutarotase